MLRPVCCGCHAEMRCQRNGVMVRFEGSTDYRGSDRYECPECGIRIVTGFSRGTCQLDDDPPAELLEVVQCPPPNDMLEVIRVD